MESNQEIRISGCRISGYQDIRISDGEKRTLNIEHWTKGARYGDGGENTNPELVREGDVVADGGVSQFEVVEEGPADAVVEREIRDCGRG